MPSGIGNRGLLQRLGKVLGIEDVKQAPQFLRTDELVPTIGLDPGMAGYVPWASQAIGLNLAGLAGVTWVIVGNQTGSGFMDPYRQVNNGDQEYAVLGLRLQFTLTAAAALADVGRTYNASYWRQLVPGGGGTQYSESFVSMGAVEDVGGTHYYLHTFPMYLRRHVVDNVEGDPNISAPVAMAIRPLWVPANTVFGLTITKDDGSAWPVGVTLDVHAWGVRTPKGMRPPGI